MLFRSPAQSHLVGARGVVFLGEKNALKGAWNLGENRECADEPAIPHHSLSNVIGAGFTSKDDPWYLRSIDGGVFRAYRGVFRGVFRGVLGLHTCTTGVHMCKYGYDGV